MRPYLQAVVAREYLYGASSFGNPRTTLAKDMDKACYWFEKVIKDPSTEPVVRNNAIDDVNASCPQIAAKYGFGARR